MSKEIMYFGSGQNQYSRVEQIKYREQNTLLNILEPLCSDLYISSIESMYFLYMYQYISVISITQD